MVCFQAPASAMRLEGGYVELGVLGLSAQLAADIAAWQKIYEESHFAGFPASEVAALNEEGLILASRVRKELIDKRIGYFSNGRMERLS